jgi:hypothetical protein
MATQRMRDWASAARAQGLPVGPWDIQPYVGLEQPARTGRAAPAGLVRRWLRQLLRGVPA